MNNKILYLFSDTGGGHRASANALIAAVNKINPHVQQEMIDVFAECSKFLNLLAKLYSPVIKYSPQLWGRLYYFWDDPGKLETLEKIAAPLIKDEFADRIRIINPNVIVSIHPLLNHLTITCVKELGKNIPIITVVTDPVTFHKAWVSPDVNLLIVATEKAYRRALDFGMPKEKIKLLGLPIDPRFLEKKNKKEILRKLGLKEDLQTILVMGGGEGGGGMEEIIKKIDESMLRVQLIVVCGRNKKLQKVLEKTIFSFPIKVYGFTYEIPTLMDAADLIITKAGPGSIAEAMAKDIPMIVSSWLPGQEEGNVEFVKSTGSGFVEKDPQKIAELIKELLKGKKLDKIKQNIKRVAKPRAGLDIAKFILSYLK